MRACSVRAVRRATTASLVGGRCVRACAVCGAHVCVRALAGNECALCPSGSGGLLSALFVVLVVLCGAVALGSLFVVRKRLARAAKSHEESLKGLISVRSPTMLATFLQVVAVLGQVGVVWRVCVCARTHVMCICCAVLCCAGEEHLATDGFVGVRCSLAREPQRGALRDGLLCGRFLRSLHSRGRRAADGALQRCL